MNTKSSLVILVGVWVVILSASCAEKEDASIRTKTPSESVKFKPGSYFPQELASFNDSLFENLSESSGRYPSGNDDTSEYRGYRRTQKLKDVFSQKDRDGVQALVMAVIAHTESHGYVVAAGGFDAYSISYDSVLEKKDTSQLWYAHYDKGDSTSVSSISFRSGYRCLVVTIQFVSQEHANFRYHWSMAYDRVTHECGVSSHFLAVDGPESLPYGKTSLVLSSEFTGAKQLYQSALDEFNASKAKSPSSAK